ncbi:hypothetical protein DL98DRAFT_581706 [Cadophora sp. DSE1049]|nr:hypothetical protein DL98DRAFT_581706 [Cadophora sp. DSE1049]
MRGCGCIRQNEDVLTVHTERCIRDQDTHQNVATGHEAGERIDCLKTVVVYATAPGLCPNCDPLHGRPKVSKAEVKPKRRLSGKFTKKWWFKKILSSRPSSSRALSPTPSPTPGPKPRVTETSKEIYNERFVQFSLKVRDQARETNELKKARSSVIRDAWATHVFSEKARDPGRILEMPRFFEDPEDDQVLPPIVPVIDSWNLPLR